jgi:ribonuclease PH
MRDLVASIAVGKVEGQLVLDVQDKEDKEGESDMPMAYMPSKNAVTLLQMDGQITHAEFLRSIELLKKGCLDVYRCDGGPSRRTSRLTRRTLRRHELEHSHNTYLSERIIELWTAVKGRMGEAFPTTQHRDIHGTDRQGEGSATVIIGGTRVTAGVKFEMGDVLRTRRTRA